MSKKRLTEKELLKDLDAHKAHADELAQTMPHELDQALEKLRGTVKRYERPTDPACDPDEWDANREK